MVKKSFKDRFSRLDTIPECDGQANGWTDIVRWHRRTMHIFVMQ